MVDITEASVFEMFEFDESSIATNSAISISFASIGSSMGLSIRYLYDKVSDDSAG